MNPHPGPSSSSSAAAASLQAACAELPGWLALVKEKVESLRFGVVQLVVHEGRVTQIDRTEKTRVTETGG